MSVEIQENSTVGTPEIELDGLEKKISRRQFFLFGFGLIKGINDFLEGEVFQQQTYRLSKSIFGLWSLEYWGIKPGETRFFVLNIDGKVRRYESSPGRTRGSFFIGFADEVVVWNNWTEVG